MAFYGREQQQKKMDRLLSKSGMQAALIYGRRRVGKSELIKQCLKKTDTLQLYYECKQTTEMNNVESLCALISEQLRLPTLGFANMELVLDYLFHRSEQEDLILVLDEYPYLRETVKGMDSVLQSLIDRYKDKSALKLVICGSYVDTMKSLLARENPLYGRMDLVIDLEPMDYYESALFYPSYSSEDRVRLYSVFGPNRYR